MLVVAAFLWALPPAARLLRIGAVGVSAGVRGVRGGALAGWQQRRALRGAAGGAAAAVRAADGTRRSGGRRAGALGVADSRRRPALGATARWRSTPAARCWRCARSRCGWCGGRCARRWRWRAAKRRARRTMRRWSASWRACRRRRRSPVRVEVPLTRSHWEAALLAPSVSLARGWDKQMETRFDRVLLEPGPDGGELRALAARAGGLLRGAAGRAAGSVERPGGAPDPRRAAVSARSVQERALARLPGARRRRRWRRAQGG